MRLQFSALTCAVWIALAYWPICSAQAGEKPDNKTRNKPDAPQDFVVCTGWHALCTASPDCRMNGDKSDCDCMRVNENHIIATFEIQDISVKHLTLTKCTNQHPCEVDQAPVCKAIKYGKYEVDNVKYRWVSTYSYRGWCSLVQIKPIACDPQSEGYSGDRYYAICDAAPCTEIKDPSDPNRPLSCRCRVDGAAFMGINGSCTGVNGGIMSSSPTWAWDFEKNTFAFYMPGYEYVRGACAPLKSDPLSLWTVEQHANGQLAQLMRAAPAIADLNFTVAQDLVKSSSATNPKP